MPDPARAPDAQRLKWAWLNEQRTSDGEEESEELALFHQQWRQELGIAQPTPGTGRGGQYLAADSLAMWATDHPICIVA